MAALSFMRFRRGVMAAFVAWVVASIWFGSDSGISVPGLLVIVGGAGLLLLMWLVLLIVTWRRKERLKAVWVGLVVAALVLAAIYSGILFHVRFLVSRRSLDRYVAETLAGGGSHQKRTHVGLFVARETEVMPNGVVRIITTPCMFDDCGIAFSRMPLSVIGEDRYVPLSGNWWRWWRRW
jgi:hypothetical protein